HIYLKKPKGVSMAQNIGFIDGVDLKAHVNNYVLVPPSNNAKGMYEWDMVHSPTSGEMTEAPLELINVLRELKPAYEYDA
ncbi:TPA: bifunctional DNA primase/polymerase, partial [Streptococcus pyogenes]|nr:bifunctional DNA primase/polymerase [Streptococcus pyogenes]HER2193668.1 bifunctional DNA primase/polymerase [Streptococcus pyogenes]HER2198973.1 bifunctional DNA primase/polymerase [Streptococcus pyogenes]HER2204195.1 bifunctional DNA primase/polymerase [Streptococcus pyogenes]HER2205982.1 bifunctional DNA primase/polymerase [Streptococcus pyogenes]